ncbi:hypothetical protein [Enterococcus sp. 5H]|uniref:hypothetical protein n=1 Tax=Enterococcus sp. 5H TaxID=1229490 RepID=UPI002303BD4E|nr:hypothetical protein [Enterococcus sp. 5H]MDA9472069.1 hypothetical protein [Enterococcus sp. 5H]
MTRRFRVDIETTWAGVGETEYFEVSDDATDEEIAEEAREIFSSYCSYGYSEDKEEAQ